MSPVCGSLPATKKTYKYLDYAQIFQEARTSSQLCLLQDVFYV